MTRLLRPRALLALAVALFAAPLAWAGQEPREFRWAGDPEGGAPYVEASPTDPNTLVGFDVEIAELIARGLKRTPRFVLVQFSSIPQSITRGDAEIGMSGIEDTPANRASLSATIPYYEFREVLAVRRAIVRSRTCLGTRSPRSAARLPMRSSPAPSATTD
jgi:polar amino acid transport system substrate-binding protein